VFYLMAALGRALAQPGIVGEYLDLVALGTVADLVGLDRNNRILVDQGLRRIRAGQCRPGISALCRVAAVNSADLAGPALGYQIAPRLNAAGRLDDMSIGVRCLLCDSDTEADELASHLDQLNRERRGIETRMKAEALELMDTVEVSENGKLPHVICLLRDDWHEGLVGLIASRIKERYYRPALAFASTESGGLKGSARSIAGFHIRDALAEVDARHPGLIGRFGGHAMAAGLNLDAQAFAAFRQAIEHIGAQHLNAETLAEKILTDGELAPEHLSLEVATLLRDVSPWGQGFPEPSFDGCFELVDFKILKGAHLKMSLRPLTDDRIIDAIAFNHTGGEWSRGQELRIVYRLAINDFFTTPKPQLIVEHLEAVV